MTDVMVVVERSFRVDLFGVESIHDRAEAVMGELVNLSEAGAILDSAVSSDSDRGIVTIEVTTRAPDLDKGVADAVSAMRAAIHAVGDATPGWPTHKDIMEVTAQTMRAEVVEMAG